MAGRNKVSKLEDRTTDITKSREPGKRKKKQTASKRPVKHRQAEQHMHVGTPEGEERKNKAERIFEEIKAKNFSNLMKNMNL